MSVEPCNCGCSTRVESDDACACECACSGPDRSESPENSEAPTG